MRYGRTLPSISDRLIRLRASCSLDTFGRSTATTRPVGVSHPAICVMSATSASSAVFQRSAPYPISVSASTGTPNRSAINSFRASREMEDGGAMMSAPAGKKTDNQDDSASVDARRDAILKRMLNTPPKPRKGKGVAKKNQSSGESRSGG